MQRNQLKQPFNYPSAQTPKYLSNPLSNQQEIFFTSCLAMIRPYKFYSNQQTIKDNIYQNNSTLTKQQINQKAIKQFDHFVSTLQDNHLSIIVVQDDGLNQTPDSIFPNNWISFHQKHKAIIYPMYAPNRRKQRQLPLIQTLQKQFSQKIQIWHNYTNYQNENIFLEGTGSMVLDRQNKIAYAVLSQRTDKLLLNKICKDLGYKQCSFHASQYCKEKNEKIAIYHTNVLMSISRHFVLISLELIDNENERFIVRQSLQKISKKKIIELRSQQIVLFAGNALTVANKNGVDLFIMSETGYKSLDQQQIKQLNKWVKIIYCDLKTIETNGGGSARCMLAEIF